MRHKWLGLILIGSLFSAACGPGKVNVTAEIEIPDPEAEGEMMTVPLAALEIQFYPFDRDALFDSLTAAFGTPEPPIPGDLLAAQEEIRTAQDAWRAAEAAWGAGRARLEQINEEIQGYNPAEARYVALFREFEDTQALVDRREREKDRAFNTFDALQQGYIQRADSMRFIQEAWADDAFADFWVAADVKMRALGEEILADTTGAQGVSGPTDVPPGQWWVHARYALAYSEYYWNVPVTVVRGDPIEVRLTGANAQMRPKL